MRGDAKQSTLTEKISMPRKSYCRVPKFWQYISLGNITN